jgi:hypothetical protein
MLQDDGERTSNRKTKLERKDEVLQMKKVEFVVSTAWESSMFCKQHILITYLHLCRSVLCKP